MLFNSYKHILFISSQKLSVVDVSHKQTMLFESAWNPSTFSQLIRGIRKKFSVNLSIVLSEELVYVTAIEIPQEISLSKDVIEKVAQEAVPEHLNETIWGYKEVLNLQKKKGQNLRIIQIAALIKTFSDLMLTAFPKAGIHIESMAPASYAYAHSAPVTDGCIMVARFNSGTLLIMSEKGFVIASEYHLGTVTSEQIISFISFIEKKFLLVPYTIILPTIVDVTLEEQLKQTGKKIDKLDVQAYSEIRKTNIKNHSGLDLAPFFLNVISNITLQVAQKVPIDSSLAKESPVVEFASQRTNNHSKIILYILLAVLVTIIIVFVGVLQSTVIKTST